MCPTTISPTSRSRARRARRAIASIHSAPSGVAAKSTRTSCGRGQSSPGPVAIAVSLEAVEAGEAAAEVGEPRPEHGADACGEELGLGDRREQRALAEVAERRGDPVGAGSAITVATMRGTKRCFS
jgi:hypothetical protein